MHLPTVIDYCLNGAFMEFAQSKLQHLGELPRGCRPINGSLIGSLWEMDAPKRHFKMYLIHNYEAIA